MSYVTIKEGYNTYKIVETENENRAAEIAAEDVLNRYDEMEYEDEY